MIHLPDRNVPNMFKKTLRACMKYIQEYDPLQYNDVTNAELDFLGFKLREPNIRINTEPNTRINTEPDTRIDIEPDICINDDIMTNVNDNDNITNSIDDEISDEFNSPSPMDTSPPRESFCDVWFRSDSPDFLPVNRPAIDEINKKENSCKQNKLQFQENVDKWHEMIQPKLHDAEQRSMFCIRDYSSQIMKSLKTSDQRKVSFDTIVQKEHPCEVARYFLASLDLVRERIIRRKTKTRTDQFLKKFIVHRPRSKI